jgi:hypothetical protein
MTKIAFIGAGSTAFVGAHGDRIPPLAGAAR